MLNKLMILPAIALCMSMGLVSFDADALPVGLSGIVNSIVNNGVVNSGGTSDASNNNKGGTSDAAGRDARNNNKGGTKPKDTGTTGSNITAQDRVGNRVDTGEVPVYRHYCDGVMKTNINENQKFLTLELEAKAWCERVSPPKTGKKAERKLCYKIDGRTWKGKKQFQIKALCKVKNKKDEWEAMSKSFALTAMSPRNGVKEVAYCLSVERPGAECTGAAGDCWVDGQCTHLGTRSPEKPIPGPYIGPPLLRLGDHK